MRSSFKVIAALAVCSALWSVDASSQVAEKKVKCKDLVYVCDDGVTKVYPNPFNQCEFDLCPEDVDEEDGEEEDEDDDDDDEDDDGDDSEDEEELPECKKVVHTCTDGVTKVYPNPLNDCEFDACPEDAQNDADDIAIEDIMDVVLTPTPTKVDDIDHDEDEWDRDLPTKPLTTIPPVAVQWTAIDAAKAPAQVQEAVQQAFALYNSTQICDKLILFYDSIEAHNETSMETHHKKEKKLQSFHIVVNVDCYLQGAKQVGGKFILNLEKHGKNEAHAYQLIDCAHLEAWGELSNWLAVRNNIGYCETPSQKHKFDVQPMKYVNYHAKELTLFDTVVRNKNYLAIVAIVVGVLAALILLVVFLLIQRRYCGYQKLRVDGASPDTAASDEVDMDIRLTPPSKRKLAEGTDKKDQGNYV